jgi:signal transduction histidine kinase
MAAAIQSGVEKLRLSEQQRTELIASISHDLRSPLTSIRGYLESALVKDAELTGEQRRELLGISLRNVASFQDLVGELFELARLETRQAQPKREPMQAAELVQDVVLKLKPQAERAGVALEVDGTWELAPVPADVGMIERVLTNLIENALRFTPAGGRVAVRLEQTAAGIRVTVADTGTGIAAEDLPHVFERFYRADRSRSGGGAGLGLAIARQIVELHGGSLVVESAPGRGAAFSFDLPLERRPDRGPSGSSAEAP